MNQRSKKAARERAIFTEFVNVAGLPVLSRSIESRPEPEPDILCELRGEGPVAFELGELIDQGLARAISIGDSNGLAVDDTALTMAAKLTKTYRTPHPMELVLYGWAIVLPRDAWLPKFGERLKDLLDRSMFRRLWVANLSSRPGDRGIWLVHSPRGSTP